MKTLKYAAILGAAALALAGLFALNSRAAQAAKPDQSSGSRLRERIKEKLNLSEEQITQIKSELKSEKSNLTDLLTRLHDARSQLRAEIQKSGATEASVREAAAKLSAVESDLAVERLKLHAKISPLLTADQREKLAQLEAGLDQFVERAISRIDERLSEK
jgi:Spy/CpxP family protein refolding chaperone